MTSVPAPHSRAPQRQSVAERIKDHILQEHLRPGQLLPTETELCEAVGASRSSVREAIKTLAALDIVEVRHGHGSYVGQMSLNALVESLAFRGLLSRGDDHRVLMEVIEVRQRLAQGFASQIISGLTEDRKARLIALVDAMRKRAARGDSFVEQDRDFHLTLMEPIGNDLVMQLTRAFWDIQAIIAPSLHATAQDAIETAELHQRVVQSASAGDVVGLQAAIASHYAPVRQRIAIVSGEDESVAGSA